MDYRVKDLSLASQGAAKISWAEQNMPVLMLLRRKYSEAKPFKGVRVGAVLHVTKETAVLMKAFIDAGAEVALAGSNPLSTQDDVAAALVEYGVHVYAWRGQSGEEYYWCLEKIVEWRPQIVLDDGADLHALIHEKHVQLASSIVGGTEETTTGVIRLRALEREGLLKYPVIAVNNAYTKHMFDNRYGTGQSTFDGILRATNMLIAGKVVVVAGYGWVGKGIAARARGLGARRVIVVEVNPIRALEAVYDGFEVMPMSEAAEVGDIFITATGNKAVVRREHFEKMKNGAVLANAGHFNVEVWIPDLEALSRSKRQILPYVTEYELSDGRRIYLLAEGRLVNLVAAEGHPSEVMDMSFANQFLASLYMLENKGSLPLKVMNPPVELDEMVARLKLESMGIRIDSMTREQEEYVKSWRHGT
ncbi:adenosylhomocysteinase [Desulfurococcus mucosus]|uniref:Adenosylhomocysteinase n=1 Tax=Desulfurococcus mucosus (strain ATCC 35584 / DSM 2162 / JCM 9187 / O7/1) TaxID=765177 RepID=E8R782_DESM0|nr:adenosylhomocysteinase [Desulfurococcus mucosus]ADV65547.1 adenosylhomocysteinase [Desulfurococcus mucosus DSM 2162]